MATKLRAGEASGTRERGPYDPDPDRDEGDLWFLPGDPPNPADWPLPRTGTTSLTDPDLWAAAERAAGARLADVAYLHGVLNERLRAGPVGWAGLVALKEAEEISWWVGDRVSADRLVLWVEMSLGGVQEDNAALLRAAWAWRRLVGGPAPWAEGWGKGLAAFLGREVTDLAAVMQTSGGLHPLTRSALALHAGRLAGVDGPTGELEAVVLAARVASRGGGPGQGCAPFLPVGLAGFAGHRAALATGADVSARLEAWLGAVERGLYAALMHLDRLRDWQAGARCRLADLKGRTPPLLIDLFATLPIVTAPLAEAKTAAGRATVQRNLALMEARGLTREMTGQGRYRVWTAKL
jgi:hypothetical protein